MAEKGHKWPELVNTQTDHSNMGMLHIYQKILIRQTLWLIFLYPFSYFSTWNMAKTGQYPKINLGISHIFRQFMAKQLISSSFVHFLHHFLMLKIGQKGHKWPELVNTHTDHSNMGMWYIYQQISIRKTLLVSFFVPILQF